jgi:hypothetical protein
LNNLAPTLGSSCAQSYKLQISKRAEVAERDFMS